MQKFFWVFFCLMTTNKFRYLLHLKKITCLSLEGIHTGVKICQDLLLCHLQWKAVKVKMLHVILASHAKSNFNFLLNCHNILRVLYSIIIIHVSFKNKKIKEYSKIKKYCTFQIVAFVAVFGRKEKWKWDISNRNRLWIAHAFGGNFARNGRLASTSSSVTTVGLLFPFSD